MKKFISPYFGLLSDKKIKRQLAFLVFLIFISSFLDMISVGLVAVFISIVMNPQLLLDHVPNGVAHFIISHHVSQNTLIYISAITIMAAFVFKTVIGGYESKKLAIFSSKQAHNLRLYLMSYYKNASYLLILNRSTSEVANLLGNQISNYSNRYLLAGLYFFATIVSILAISVLLCLTHFIATLTLIVFLSGFYFIYTRFLRDGLEKISRVNYQAHTRLFKGLQEFFRGYKEVKVLQKEEFFINQIKKESDSLAQVEGKLAVYQAIPRYIIELVFVTFIIGLSIGLTFFGKNSETIIPVVGLFVVAGARLMPLVNRALNYGSQMKFSLYVVQALYDELTLISNTQLDKTITSTLKATDVFERVTFNNVYFRYPNIEKDALKNIHLEISAGQSIGIVGKTGAGKTTLINLLIGLFEATSGKIEVNGVDVTTCLSYWLSQIAYIPQDIFLLEGTLRQNIIFGEDPSTVDQARLEESAKLAWLDKVVAGLPQGFDTMLGENGIKLSGGQRQRVALARAFYHQRNIIIMDEATSALDHETETEIMNSIKRLHGVKTLIIITHRLTTIKHCDFVYKLKDGQIVDAGTYETVIEKTPLSQG